MGEALIVFVTYLLAAYGLICLLMTLVQSFGFFLKPARSRVKLVLLMKNQENTVEGIVRSVISDDIMKKLMSDGELVIIDLGSSDKTFEMLEMLQKEYECVSAVRGEDRDKILNVFSRVME